MYSTNIQFPRWTKEIKGRVYNYTPGDKCTFFGCYGVEIDGGSITRVLPTKTCILGECIYVCYTAC